MTAKQKRLEVLETARLITVIKDKNPPLVRSLNRQIATLRASIARDREASSVSR